MGQHRGDLLATVGGQFRSRGPERAKPNALSISSSCIFPALIYTFFWPRFNRRGLLWSVYGGLALCLLFTIGSPAVSGTESSLWPTLDLNWYPYYNAGLFSTPAALFLGWLGTLTSSRHNGTKSREAYRAERGVGSAATARNYRFNSGLARIRAAPSSKKITPY